MRQLLSVFCMFAVFVSMLTGCNGDTAQSVVIEDGDPAEYEGVHIQEGSTGAIVLYANGRFETYSITARQEPEITSKGLFKVSELNCIINMSENEKVEEFSIDRQIMQGEDGILSGFTKLSDDTSYARQLNLNNEYMDVAEGSGKMHIDEDGYLTVDGIEETFIRKTKLYAAGDIPNITGNVASLVGTWCVDGVAKNEALGFIDFDGDNCTYSIKSGGQLEVLYEGPYTFEVGSTMFYAGPTVEYPFTILGGYKGLSILFDGILLIQGSTERYLLKEDAIGTPEGDKAMLFVQLIRTHWNSKSDSGKESGMVFLQNGVFLYKNDMNEGDPYWNEKDDGGYWALTDDQTVTLTWNNGTVDTIMLTDDSFEVGSIQAVFAK